MTVPLIPAQALGLSATRRCRVRALWGCGLVSVGDPLRAAPAGALVPYKYRHGGPSLWIASLSSAVHWRGGTENPRILDLEGFHLDTRRVPKLVPHPARHPGAEVGDPSKVKLRIPQKSKIFYF